MGRSPCCIKEGLKKGPWTHEEDQKLIAFIKDHGHGNWRSLPKQCGLLRCGKSCRLRWTNYLRPDIKRGLFTHSEEQKIIQLHALVGNRWAFIASQLPRRTDNEIKNYWNTVLKKRLRKVGLLSLGTHSTLTPAEERQRQRQIDNKSSSDNIMQGNTNCSPSAGMSCSHLAQWESARLEAEARLAKESQSSRITHKLLSFKYMGHSFSNSNTSTATTTTTTSTTTSTTSNSAFSSFPNSTYTDQHALQQLSNCLFDTFPSPTSSPCLIQHPSSIGSLSSTSSLCLPTTTNSLSSTSSLCLPTINSLSNTSINSLSNTSNLSLCLPTINPLSNTSINSLSNTSNLSLSAIISYMPPTCSASNNSSTSCNIVSSKSLSSLSSQESIASALTLGPTGRLSWQTKELSFTPSPAISDTSQSSLMSQMLCIMNKDHGNEVELVASTKGDLDPAGNLKAIRGNEQMILEATSSMMHLNRALENAMDLNSTMDNWQDFLFDVENSCSDVVSTNWKDPILSSSEREEFTHDSASLINNSTKSGTLEGPHASQVPDVYHHRASLDVEGLNLLHYDSLMSCEHYETQQYSKELLWDHTPTTLSVSSNSFVS